MLPGTAEPRLKIQTSLTWSCHHPSQKRVDKQPVGQTALGRIPIVLFGWLAFLLVLTWWGCIQNPAGSVGDTHQLPGLQVGWWVWNPADEGGNENDGVLCGAQRPVGIAGTKRHPHSEIWADLCPQQVQVGTGSSAQAKLFAIHQVADCTKQTEGRSYKILHTSDQEIWGCAVSFLP